MTPHTRRPPGNRTGSTPGDGHEADPHTRPMVLELPATPTARPRTAGDVTTPDRARGAVR
jgi:hypothetical protein